MVEPSMIGYQEFIDGFNLAKVQKKEIRIQFLNKKLTEVGDTVVVIETSWEKRFLKVPQMVEGKTNGQSLFFIHKVNNQWRVVGQSGDHLFAP